MKKDKSLIPMLAGAALLYYVFFVKKAAATPGGTPVTPGGPGTFPTTPGTGTFPTTPGTGTFPTTPGGTPTTPPVNAQAYAIASNLTVVQSRYGGPVKARGHEDMGLIKGFQSSESLTVDGKTGPGTMLRIAETVSVLPLIMYWRKGATRQDVLDYRASLNALAAQSAPQRAVELRASAERERGQAGVSGGPL